MTDCLMCDNPKDTLYEVLENTSGKVIACEVINNLCDVHREYIKRASSHSRNVNDF